MEAAAAPARAEAVWRRYANQPFREADLGHTRVQRSADRRFSVIPDVVANCGMARAFSFLMAEAESADPAPVFRAVDRTVTGALLEILSRGGGRPTGLLGAAFDHALDRWRRDRRANHRP